MNDSYFSPCIIIVIVVDISNTCAFMTCQNVSCV